MKRAIMVLFLALVLGCSQEVMQMKLTSPAFENNGNIPAKYTCKGENINPELAVGGVPSGTKSLVLIIDDPDAPAGIWDHWVVFNIPAVSSIAENSIPGTQGKNSWGKNDYSGPCPPSGTHRYFFKLYALDAGLDLNEDATKEDIEEAMKGHILAEARLVGKYTK